MASISVRLIGSAWVMGEDGETLRNTGGTWTKFMSNNPNESDASSNLTLYGKGNPYFLGNWAAGTQWSSPESDRLGRRQHVADARNIEQIAASQRATDPVQPVEQRQLGRWVRTTLARDDGESLGSIRCPRHRVPRSRTPSHSMGPPTRRRKLHLISETLALDLGSGPRTRAVRLAGSHCSCKAIHGEALVTSCTVAVQADVIFDRMTASHSSSNGAVVRTVRHRQ